MRIDAHVHVWTGEPTRDVRAGAGALDRQDTVERLRPLAEQTDIQAVIAVQTVGSEAETRRLLAIADVDPLVAGVVGWVDLAATDVGARLDRLHAGAGGGRITGIRTMLPADEEAASRPDLLRGMRALIDRGLALDLLIRPAGLSAALSVADAMPQLRIVVDHLAKPSLEPSELHHWTRWMRALAERRNVAVKLSGLLTQLDPGQGTDALLPHVSLALHAFGAQRTMIGSDWPLCESAGGYQRAIRSMERLVAECGVDGDLVSGGTAEAWYRLALRTGNEA